MSRAGPAACEPGIEGVAFDPASGSAMERLIFNHRLLVVTLCLLVTGLLALQLGKLRPNGSFERMTPTSHPYIANFLAHRDELPGGNLLRVVVAAKKGSIYSADYLGVLQKINDELFLLPGVDRAKMRSIWTPATRWTGVTEEGLEGGPVIPNHYNGSQASLDQLRINIARSGEVGQLVARDEQSSIVSVPLLERNADGTPLDYSKLSGQLEDIRDRYLSQGVSVHIVGFAKIIGDLVDGLGKVLGFFVVSIGLSAIALFAYTRCLRSTVLVISCSLIAVIWQLGLLPVLGFDLDPYSMLVPFLVFAIGMSHGAQKMNGIMQDVGRGASGLVAARFTFRRLFVPGLMALLCDAVGFAVLLLIPIAVIRDLAMISSLGVAVLILTNLILLPVLLSYVGVSSKAAARSIRGDTGRTSFAVRGRLWLVGFARRDRALPTIIVAAVLAVGAYLVGLRLQIGDLQPGAPELRQSSRYNVDSRYLGEHYGASSDLLVVMVVTPAGGCTSYDTLLKVDALEWELRQLNDVESSVSLASLVRRIIVGMNEGSPLWYELIRSQAMINSITAAAPRGLYNEECSLLPIPVFLKDHKAQTLVAVTSAVKEFAVRNDTAEVKFLLAAGNAGFEAATNEVVKESNLKMLLAVYIVVSVLCLVTFRSWRAVLCAILPLALTSMLGEALMVSLGIGVKVATLPVIALGVGIGVDYALYVMSIVLGQLRSGATLSEAYESALRFTGGVVLFTGVTLAICVVTWSFSPIKFQADMGLLLAFMFVFNMIGALVLLPALASYLLPHCDQAQGGLGNVEAERQLVGAKAVRPAAVQI